MKFAVRSMLILQVALYATALAAGLLQLVLSLSPSVTGSTGMFVFLGSSLIVYPLVSILGMIGFWWVFLGPAGLLVGGLDLLSGGSNPDNRRLLVISAITAALTLVLIYQQFGSLTHFFGYNHSLNAEKSAIEDTRKELIRKLQNGIRVTGVDRNMLVLEDGLIVVINSNPKVKIDIDKVMDFSKINVIGKIIHLSPSEYGIDDDEIRNFMRKEKTYLYRMDILFQGKPLY